MAWNEPSGPGDKDPWGKRKKEQGPPDLDQIVKNIQAKLGGLFGGGKGRGGDGDISQFGMGLILIVAVALWLLSGLYIIQQGERGVVLLFGKKGDITEAGLHWHLPFPIERVEKVNVEEVSTITVGYRRDDRANINTKVPKEALMLTQDENIVDIEFSVQYRIKDAADYLFNVRDPINTIFQATESAVREIVGKNTFDYIITDGREEVAVKTQALLQDILDRYKSGINIVGIKMQDAKAPEEVTAAFEDAVKAREDEQRFKNEAQAYSNDVIPRARGAAGRIKIEAEGYKASVIARAEGEARRFTLIAREYARAPAVTRERLYIEAVEQVLKNTTKVFIDQKGGNNILYLPLDKMLSQGAGSGAGPVSNLQPLPEPEDNLAPLSSRDRGRTRGGQ